MLKAAARAGWIDEQKVTMENMYAFTRAGADMIITYHAKEILKNKWM
jgi:porphobilinogen synthase